MKKLKRDQKKQINNLEGVVRQALEKYEDSVRKFDAAFKDFEQTDHYKLVASKFSKMYDDAQALDKALKDLKTYLENVCGIPVEIEVEEVK